MTSPRSGTSRAGPGGNEREDAVLVELRRMNRLFASFTTRGMEQRAAISFLDAAGFSPTQIGEILGVKAVTVRTNLHRARKASGSIVAVEEDLDVGA